MKLRQLLNFVALFTIYCTWCMRGCATLHSINWWLTLTRLALMARFCLLYVFFCGFSFVVSLLSITVQLINWKDTSLSNVMLKLLPLSLTNKFLQQHFHGGVIFISKFLWWWWWWWGGGFKTMLWQHCRICMTIVTFHYKNNHYCMTFVLGCRPEASNYTWWEESSGIWTASYETGAFTMPNSKCVLEILILVGYISLCYWCISWCR